MKWVKVAIGAVIAIAVVPMIALSVFNLTQEKVKEEVVTFEILTLNEGIGTIDINAYELINDYIILNNDIGNNVINVKVNNIDRNISIIYNTEYTMYQLGGGGDYDIVIKDNNIIEDDGGVTTPVVGDVWKITFEVTQPPVLSGVTASLLLLAPLIFVSGILYFIYNNKQEGI